MATQRKIVPRLGTYDYVLLLADRKEPNLEEIADAIEFAHAEGDRRATYALAAGYLQGRGGYAKDIRKAVSLLKLAAHANVAAAHFDLAVCYESGEGVKKNEKIAYRHYLTAAVNGDNDSLVEVGRCLFHGIGVERDRKAAEIWFRRAETLGIRVN